MENARLSFTSFVCKLSLLFFFFSKGFMNVLGPSYRDAQALYTTYTAYTEVNASPCVLELPSLGSPQGASG